MSSDNDFSGTVEGSTAITSASIASTARRRFLRPKKLDSSAATAAWWMAGTSRAITFGVQVPSHSAPAVVIAAANFSMACIWERAGAGLSASSRLSGNRGSAAMRAQV